MSRPIVTAAAAALLLPGCAAQVMQSWVGRPVAAAVARFGPPASIVELDRGRRAYGWTVDLDEGLRVTGSGMNTDQGAVPTWTQGTRVSATGGESGRCVRTFYARWSGGAWIIDGYDPKIACS